MLKKLFSLMICFSLLLLPSCAENGKTGENAEGVPCPIEGLEWGMTVDECLTALSLTEEDVEIQRDVAGNATKITVGIMLSGQEAYGFPVKGIGLTFYENVYDVPVGLYNMSIRFDPVPSLAELQTAVKGTMPSYMSEDPDNVRNDGNSQTYVTGKTLADVDADLVEKYFQWEWQGVTSGTAGGSREKKDYPYGLVWIGEAVSNGEAYVIVDNLVATVLEKAAEAENK